MSKTSHLVIPSSLVREALTLDPFIPASHNLFPKLRDRLNGSAWELWYVDGISSDGQTGLAIGMTRDARGASKGGFRVEVHAIWRDGACGGTSTKQPAVSGIELYFPESIFTEDAEGKITAVWQSPRRAPTEDADQSSPREQPDMVTLTASADLSAVTLWFQIPSKATGSVVLRSGSSHRADIERVSRPSREENAMLGPKVYYLRPQPISCVEAQLAIQMPQEHTTGSEHHEKPPSAMREFRLTTADQAIGGMDRFWAPQQWPQLMSESYHVRAGAGPYRLHLLRLLTTKEAGREPQVSARLYRDGRVVCEAQLERPAGTTCLPGEEEGSDYITFQKKYAADEDRRAVRGKYREKCSGCCIEFVHPRGEESRQRWRFVVDYVREWWSIPLSAPIPEATGNSSFLVTVTGGLVNVHDDDQDNEHFQGNGGCGQAALP